MPEQKFKKDSYTTGPAGLAIILNYEKIRLKAYPDAVGVWTIGIGHTSAQGPPRVKKGDTITKEEAVKILLDDLKIIERDVREDVTVELTQNQFDALVSFVLNIGETAFLGSTLLHLLNNGLHELAAEEFKKWVKGRVNGKKVTLAGLVKRRADELILFNKKDIAQDYDQQPPIDSDNSDNGIG